MNHTKYQALVSAASESSRLANTYFCLGLGCLGWSLTGGHLSFWLRIFLAFGSVCLALVARETKALATEATKKANRFRLQLEELEAIEAALEFANAKVSLEESFGLICDEPEVVKPEPKVFKAPKESWDSEFSGDFGFSALAPDAREEIRSWLSLDFACSSKIICAASGSGKSSYLRWEYQQASQDRTTYLIDGHLAANHLEGVTWTGTKESDLRIVSHDEYQISRTLTDLIAEVRARLKGLRPLNPVHVLIDESDGNIFKEEPICSLLPEFVELVANEARKTKVTVSLVTHSVQKQKTGLDASDLCQIKWLILGNALAVPHSRWPGDLDPKAWRTKQSQLQSTLDPSESRACVLYQQSGISLEVLELSVLGG